MSEARRRELYLFAAAFLLRLAWVADFSRLPFFDLPTSDSLFYAQQASRIAGGHLLGTGLSYPSSPLYPYLVAPFLLLSGRARFWGVDLLQAILDACSAVLLKRTGSILFGRLAGWTAGIAWAAYGLAVFFSADLMEATAAAFLANLFMYLFVRKAPWSPGTGLACGAAAGLACLMRPHFLPVAALAVLAVVWVRAPQKPAAAAILLAAGLALPLGASLARNFAVSGEIVLVSPYSGLNAYLGNNREATGSLSFPHGRGLRNDVDLRRAAHVYPESVEGREMSESQVSAFWWREAGREILADPARWAGLMLRKLRLFWSSREIPNHLDFYFFRSASVPLSAAAVSFGMLSPLALAAAIVILGRFPRTAASPAGRRALFLTAATLLYWMVCATFFIGDRFRFPVTGWIAILAGAALASILSWLSGGRLLAAAGLAAAAAVFGVALHDPIPVHHGAREYVLVAAALEGRGDTARAERLLRRAVELDPESAVARYNLGRRLAADGDIDGAEAEIRKAVSIAPDFSPAHMMLGDLALRSSPAREDLARKQYARALAIEPYGLQARRIEAALAALGEPSPRPR